MTTRNDDIPAKSGQAALTADRELWCPSIDVCAICGDTYCDGISCVQDLHPDDDDDERELVEQIQTWVRLGRIQEQANAFVAHVENRS
jgi:hypothetical protein